ncbi:MAG: hypothetical protein AB7N99_09225 [Simkaniaceae bacterium]|jgi:hypothetical protein
MKGLFLSLIIVLLLAGCHREPWQHSSIRNGNGQHDLAKLTYPASNPNSGIELAITRHGKEILGYIHVHSYTLPLYQENPHETFLTIETEQASQTFVIPLFEGGQRARLSPICLDYLLQTLELKPSVTLSSGHFSETLNSGNFHRHYDALLREPSRLLPESLVTFELY